MSNICRICGKYSCLSSTSFWKPIQHKCLEIFISLLRHIRKAYPTEKLGDILVSPRPHSESLSNTNVGRYSYLSSTPFGKPTENKCREVFLPLLGPILKAYPIQMSGGILTSPRSHSESLSNTNIGRYSCLSSVPSLKPSQHKCHVDMLCNNVAHYLQNF